MMLASCGTAVLAKVRDDAADATVGVGLLRGHPQVMTIYRADPPGYDGHRDPPIA
jgi:hypothetical protein